jgi:hypothetical protein
VLLNEHAYRSIDEGVRFRTTTQALTFETLIKILGLYFQFFSKKKPTMISGSFDCFCRLHLARAATMIKV